MGRVLKYNILLAQALMFSSISFGQLNVIDHSLKESRIGPMRFRGVTIRKQIAQASVFNIMYRPERQLNRALLNSTQLVFFNRNVVHRGKANKKKNLNYPQIYFLNAFKTNNKASIKINARLLRRGAPSKDDCIAVVTPDTRRANLIENLDRISLQTITRYCFKQSHCLGAWPTGT